MWILYWLHINSIFPKISLLLSTCSSIQFSVFPWVIKLHKPYLSRNMCWNVPKSKNNSVKSCVALFLRCHIYSKSLRHWNSSIYTGWYFLVCNVPTNKSLYNACKDNNKAMLSSWASLLWIHKVRNRFYLW